METKTREKIEGVFFCEKCNYRCKYNSDFVKHTKTAKHNLETNIRENSAMHIIVNVGKYIQRVLDYGNTNKNVFKIIL